MRRASRTIDDALSRLRRGAASALLLAVFVIVAVAQVPTPVPPIVRVPSLPFPPPPRIGPPVQPVICTGDEEPCDPDKPWMRGRVEKFCGTAGQLAAYKEKLGDGKIVLACVCKHTCTPDDKNAAMTDGRAWDGKCETRCNPKNCICPHPCDS